VPPFTSGPDGGVVDVEHGVVLLLGGAICGTINDTRLGPILSPEKVLQQGQTWYNVL